MNSGPVGYIVVQATVRIPVWNLNHYEASNIGEVVENQRIWYEEGAVSLAELIECGDGKPVVTFMSV